MTRENRLNTPFKIINTCIMWGMQPITLLEQLQQFGKSTWHPSNFGKTRKHGLMLYYSMTTCWCKNHETQLNKDPYILPSWGCIWCIYLGHANRSVLSSLSFKVLASHGHCNFALPIRVISKSQSTFSALHEHITYGMSSSIAQAGGCP
jgi:hypothetical protein